MLLLVSELRNCAELNLNDETLSSAIRRMLRPTEKGEDCQMKLMVVTVMMIIRFSFFF